ncbi:unnamed protein product [Anisakis simplex]|uniref:Secreted protein n=1 Tax=Anisakis simplex TaxID=6269 RepID=A0A0M3JTL1_ANISI|nr:unnamed protein product [Anisakis simplex]
MHFLIITLIHFLNLFFPSVSGLTKSQRIANQFKQSHLRDVTPPPTLHNLYRQERSQNGDQIDSLIRDMEWKMKTGVGAAGESMGSVDFCACVCVCKEPQQAGYVIRSINS